MLSPSHAPQARSESFLITLMGTGCATQGNVHTHQLKALDFVARKARVVEAVPPVIIAEVLERLRVVLED